MRKLLKKNKFNWIVIVQLLICTIKPALGEEAEFRIVEPLMAMSYSQLKYLGILPSQRVDGRVPFWARVRHPKHPGQYFNWPDGANSMSVENSERAELESLLRQNVRDTYYNRYVLENVSGYEYTFDDSVVWRREYFVSYAKGDTIYVIAGWLGKFFCFCRAVPGDFRYDARDLQKEIVKISPSWGIAKENSFTHIDEEFNYLLEYIDKSSKMRVRNYQIDAVFRSDKPSEKERKYNLIEITKFIDPEVIP